MVDTIYIEREIREHFRTLSIVKRYPKARIIDIEYYGEVFNSNGQNFKTQKLNPSLILAVKKNKKVLSTPSQYETGGGANYYFSHMLNCIYDCRYCFLQGMFRSANYLLFVNYEDFIEEIKATANNHKTDDKPCWFFSGYDCDSLAYDPVSGFSNYFIDEFEKIPNSILELRTKSTQIRTLLNREPIDNVVVAYSLSPSIVAKNIEIGAPSLEKRIDAIVKLASKGWRIGLRFDPIIWNHDFQQQYAEMLLQIFSRIDASQLDSVTLGSFRLPKGFYKIMHKYFPDHWLFNAGLTEESAMITYKKEIEDELFEAVERETLKYINQELLYSYPSDSLTF